MDEKKNIPITEEKWKKKLRPEQYRILREKGTEPAFSGKFYKSKDKGVYVCAACGNPLFSSDTKFDSGTGWPSFWQPLSDKSVEYAPDKNGGIERIEIRCGKCGSHLGHVFDDGPKTLPDGRQATGKRFCVNSLALKIKKN